MPESDAASDRQPEVANVDVLKYIQIHHVKIKTAPSHDSTIDVDIEVVLIIIECNVEHPAKAGSIFGRRDSSGWVETGIGDSPARSVTACLAEPDPGLYFRVFRISFSQLSHAPLVTTTGHNKMKL